MNWLMEASIIIADETQYLCHIKSIFSSLWTGFVSLCGGVWRWGTRAVRWGRGGGGSSDCFESSVWGWVGGGGGILAVREPEDDRLGCHSRPLFLIGCDVPRWTSAQPGSLWLPALPVRSNADTNCTISCFRGGTAALLASGVCRGVIWLLFWCLQGLIGGNCTASVSVFFFFLSGKSAEQITPKL